MDYKRFFTFPPNIEVNLSPIKPKNMLLVKNNVAP